MREKSQLNQTIICYGRRKGTRPEPARSNEMLSAGRRAHRRVVTGSVERPVSAGAARRGDTTPTGLGKGFPGLRHRSPAADLSGDAGGDRLRSRPRPRCVPAPRRQRGCCGVSKASPRPAEAAEGGARPDASLRVTRKGLLGACGLALWDRLAVHDACRPAPASPAPRSEPIHVRADARAAVPACRATQPDQRPRRLRTHADRRPQQDRRAHRRAHQRSHGSAPGTRTDRDRHRGDLDHPSDRCHPVSIADPLRQPRVRAELLPAHRLRPHRALRTTSDYSR